MVNGSGELKFIATTSVAGNFLSAGQPWYLKVNKDGGFSNDAIYGSVTREGTLTGATSEKALVNFIFYGKRLEP